MGEEEIEELGKERARWASERAELLRLAENARESADQAREDLQRAEERAAAAHAESRQAWQQVQDLKDRFVAEHRGFVQRVAGETQALLDALVKPKEQRG